MESDNITGETEKDKKICQLFSELTFDTGNGILGVFPKDVWEGIMLCCQDPDTDSRHGSSAHDS